MLMRDQYKRNGLNRKEAMSEERMQHEEKLNDKLMNIDRWLNSLTACGRENPRF